MENNNSDLFVMNADGSEIVQLTNTPQTSERYPDWSPDGKTLVLSAFGGTQAGLYLMDPDGSNVRLLLAGPLHYPRWSPDGQYIAFDGQLGCQFDVYIVRADGSDLRQVTQHPAGCSGYNKSPSWSPDGSQLAYASSDRSDVPGFDIFVINVDGSHETALTHGRTDLYHGGSDPDWSPVP